MEKKITKQMVGDVEVTIGTPVAVTNWLTFTYKVVEMPRKNKFICEGDCGNIILTKGHKYWKANGHSKVGVKFNPDHKEVSAHNHAIETSERWMCM